MRKYVIGKNGNIIPKYHYYRAVTTAIIWGRKALENVEKKLIRIYINRDRIKRNVNNLIKEVVG